MVERQLPKLHTGVRFPSPASLIGETHGNGALVITHLPKSIVFYVRVNVIFCRGGLAAQFSYPGFELHALPFDGLIYRVSSDSIAGATGNRTHKFSLRDEPWEIFDRQIHRAKVHERIHAWLIATKEATSETQQLVSDDSFGADN